MPFTAMSRPRHTPATLTPGRTRLFSLPSGSMGWDRWTWRVEYPFADGPVVNWRDQHLNPTDEVYQSTARPAEARVVLSPAFEGFSPTPEMPEIAEAQALLVAIEADAHLGRE